MTAKNPVRKPGWPLMVIFAGFPLWWLTGLTQIIFFAMSVPMVVHLMRDRDIQVPRRFGLWLLFLVWTLGAIFVMQVDAPGTVPGASMSRYATFAYRYGWYIIGTVAMLYVINIRSSLSSHKIATALSWLFLVVVGGGLLGVLMPTLEFASLLEIALPKTISNDGFVNSLIHIRVAQIHEFLGYVKPRPSAPFLYSNTWGLVYALTVPFFVVIWGRRGRPFQLATIAILVVSAIPVVSSLNRGLWLALLVMIGFTIIRVALSGHAFMLGFLLIGIMAAISLFWLSPLGDLIADRLNTPHSDEGRTNLSMLAVQSTFEGSPLIGFGTTRDIQGNFSSIAGGATAQCPQCSPPPLGTQGQLWLIIFTSGLGGIVLYAGYVTSQFVAHLRDRSAYSSAALCALIALIVTMPVYDAAGIGIFVGLIAIGILVRERDHTGGPRLADLVLPLRRKLTLILSLVAVGGLTGASIQAFVGTASTATFSVVIPTNKLLDVEGARPLSLDSEAHLAVSDAVLTATASAVDAGGGLAEIDNNLAITAEPNTRILNFNFSHQDPLLAVLGGRTAAETYISLRQQMVIEARSHKTARLEAQQQYLARSILMANRYVRLAGPELNQEMTQTADGLLWQSRSVAASLADLRADDRTDAGEVLRSSNAVRSIDPWLVKTGSGAMVGLVLGLLLAWSTDGRVLRLGPRSDDALGLELPLVAEVPMAPLEQPDRRDWSEALRAVGTYAPLCGILADANSPVATSVAQRLERNLGPATAHSGSRVLLVASSRSPARPLRRLFRSCLQAGQTPVGLVLAHERPPSRSD